MRIFLTGSTGVIGRRLIPRLVVAGHGITAVGRAAEKREHLRELGATPVQVDLFDPPALRRAVSGHDTVINLATSIPASSRAFLPGAWRETARLRRLASANLVDAAIAGGADRFIQESFAPIYRDGGDDWIDEESPVKPARYNSSVLDAEAAAQRFSAGGRVGIALRFALFYGPDSGYTVDTIRYINRVWAPVFGSPAASIIHLAR